jgi:hypothetical protein
MSTFEPVDPSSLAAITGGQVRAPAFSNKPVVWRNGFGTELQPPGPSFPSGPHYKTNPYLNPHTRYFDVPRQPPVWRR